RVGIFPKKVIGQRPLPVDYNMVRLFSPYPEALINLTITEEDIISDQIFQTVPVNNVRFIKGITPLNGWLSEMPTTRFMTKKGIATFAFLSHDNIANTIDVSGDITTIFTITNIANPFYSCFVPMEALGDLEPGNEIEIAVLDQVLKVIIAPEGPDHSII